MRVWYRRRSDNVGRKVGNLHDFVTRWGGRYDFMIVLDADSILAPDTLVTLVREMAADPNLGLLQTVPRLVRRPHAVRAAAAIRGRASTGRSSRAASRAGRATTATTGATTRSSACARSRRRRVCRSCPGKKPFGGAILSHDFVEAALLRRAGWSVRMLPTLGGSWEDSPPSLLDVAARDRRWAQGNIQHLAVVGAQGFTWPNRVHMWIGVMSYLASPLWFALIVVGLGTCRRTSRRCSSSTSPTSCRCFRVGRCSTASG